MSQQMQLEPPDARLGAPRQSLTWTLIALALLTAGALAFAAGVIRWWDPCFTDGFDSDGCITRQDHSSDLTGLTALPSDQRQAAIMLAASTLLIGLLWFSLVVVGGKSVLVRVVACLGGAFTIAGVLPDLLWHTQGWLPFGGDEIVPMLHLPGLIIVPCVIAALLIGGLGDTGRLGLLIIGLLAGSVFSVLFEYFFWQMIYASHDTPPGSGWLQSGLYTICGVGILYLTLRRRSLAKARS
jgi:hypothetical protein